MTYLNAVLVVTLFWSFLHGLQRFVNRLGQRSILPWNLNQSRGQFGSSLQITLHHVHLSIHTAACNSLHDRFMNIITSKRNKKIKSCLSLLYKLGYFLSILGMIGATLILFWTCWLLLWKTFKHKQSTASHLRRDNLHGASQPNEWLTLTPIIPGITVPMSDFPIIICAVFMSQIIHELGHAISAAIEKVPIKSIGASLTLVVPSASVAFAPGTLDGLSYPSQSIIVSAGPFHNLIFWFVLALVTRANVGYYFWQLAYYDLTSKGRIIVDVASNSAVSEYLPSGSLMTHVNDVPLGSIGFDEGPWDLLQRYAQTESSKGWCVDSSMLSTSRACCDRDLSTASPLACFRTLEESSAAYGCLDPVPLLTTPNTTRCDRYATCPYPLVCSRPDEQEQLWRLTIINAADEQGVILWSGPLEEIQSAVKTDYLKPRLWIIPLHLHLTISRYSSYLSLATLSLFFFNLLPIRLLDGHHILGIILGVGGDGNDRANEYDMEAIAEARPRLLALSKKAPLLSMWVSRLTLGTLVLSILLTVLSVR